MAFEQVVWSLSSTSELIFITEVLLDDGLLYIIYNGGVGPQRNVTTLRCGPTYVVAYSLALRTLRRVRCVRELRCVLWKPGFSRGGTLACTLVQRL